MNTVWAFGDSYTTCLQPDQWIQQIADKLGYNAKTFGCGGSALAYTYYKFKEQYKNIKKDDIVIVCLTTLERRWFIKNDPEAASNLLYGVETDVKLSEAYKQYTLYLNQNKELEELYLELFLNFLNVNSSNRTIVISGFNDTLDVVKNINHNYENIHCVTKGSLVDVSFGELNKVRLTLDPRPCHLIKSNHTILANKVLDYIKENKEIDLKKDFLQQIVNKQFLDSKQDELFYVSSIGTYENQF